ncbi:hypothetical protein JL720_10188 [Aureococcus anophagefferens]|nr:hypothetical protein JL720_10188 [Aureococcus anophagefferens]
MASSTREVHMAELSDQVDLCAYRATFTFLGNYLWHELGALETAYEWDARCLSSAFYVPSIDAPLTLSKNGVPHLKRSYAGAAGETWYVVVAFNPYNGETIALHPTTAYRGEYPAFEASMCPTHNATGWRTSPVRAAALRLERQREGRRREGQATGASGGACRITEIMAYTSIMEGDDDALDAAILAPVRFVESRRARAT